MTTQANTTQNATVESSHLRHPHLASIIEECQLMQEAGNNANLILLCGPTGVGKTTLGYFLVGTELQRQTETMASNPGFIPAIRVEAPASGEREFSWRLFYQRILHALEGELDVPRTAYSVDPTTGRLVRPTGTQSNRLSGLRTAVERSLRNRGTRFIVVDEAAHMMRQCRPNQLEQQLDTLKSLSNEFGVQWILLGSYDLFELATLNGQLTRRTHVIHFGRYREDVPEDVLAFRRCLIKLGKGMPALKDVDLQRYADVFQQNTLGCIGTLRTLLMRLNLMVAGKGWSEDLLCRALMTEAQTTQILREILEGEERIAPGLKRSLLPAQFATKTKVA
ncbi:ATP-binding protein [Chromobacterium rhizoryzae]|uniref:ATP-binding protein n=1 Tax=Chromobacterium rhizoryzae TaxID=1778675 RepID=A0AAD0W9W9_9NEIS|nr:ATP-binding protein [Chromobacterium rhizoryzae]AXT48849.1 ATP-binding protein [Chromobacterium rhizoryzae]